MIFPAAMSKLATMIISVSFPRLGVEMDVPISFYLEGVKIEKGLQTLNGIQAEKVVRERYSYPTGDFGRIL